MTIYEWWIVVSGSIVSGWFLLSLILKALERLDKKNA